MLDGNRLSDQSRLLSRFQLRAYARHKKHQKTKEECGGRKERRGRSKRVSNRRYGFLLVDEPFTPCVGALDLRI